MNVFSFPCIQKKAVLFSGNFCLLLLIQYICALYLTKLQEPFQKFSRLCVVSHSYSQIFLFILILAINNAIPRSVFTKNPSILGKIFGTHIISKMVHLRHRTCQGTYKVFSLGFCCASASILLNTQNFRMGRWQAGTMPQPAPLALSQCHNHFSIHKSTQFSPVEFL